MKKFLPFLFLMAALESCNNNCLKPIEFVKWSENPKNGLRVIKAFSDVRFTLQYEPYNYLIAIKEKKAQITKNEFMGALNRISDFQYCKLKIEALQSSDVLKVKVVNESDYQDRINYFSFEAQKDVTLIDGQDTLPCKIYHFERVVGIAPYCYIVLGFPTPKIKHPNANKTIIFNDEIFGYGTLKFCVSSESLKNTPQMQLTKI